MTDRALPRVSSRRLAVFAWYAQRMIRRHFAALRVMQDTLPARGPPQANVFYANHAAWWDPLVMLVVARVLFPGTTFHAPIDAAALARYPSLQRFGFFGIEVDSPAGARRLLEVGQALLARPGNALALTPQGRFADVRERPLHLKSGIARLLMTVPRAVALPVAIEYPFWTEMRPEVLIRFGRHGVCADGGTRDAMLAELGSRMTAELDELGRASCRRDPSEFVTLLDGQEGIGRLQDLPARFRAWRTGVPFDGRHSAVRTNDARSGRRPERPA